MNHLDSQNLEHVSENTRKTGSSSGIGATGWLLIIGGITIAILLAVAFGGVGTDVLLEAVLK